ncbi:MAG TPA: TraB/GumN family protein [Bacteroidales bacterium]|nr:TraB/GumN family protein [Bacteroidales bacterium]HPS27825.1 TraB/GumN family protein [Bacteroidales bacterium]
MFRKLLLIAVLAVFSLQAFSQTDNSLLWEISGKGLSQKSYIFGTIHMIKKQDFFITPAMVSSLEKCQYFVTEIDMNISLAQQLDLAKKMYLPETKTLRDYISRDEYTDFSNYVIDSIGIKKSKLEKYIRLKPFFMSSIFAKHIAGKIKSYEQELYKLSKKKGMISDGLESLDFQLSLIEETPIEEQARTLVSDIHGYKKMEQQLTDMVAAYKDQDLDKLYDFVVNYADANPEFNENFIFRRNQNWIPKIEEKIKDHSCFIAVGAAHLPGEKGVLTMLQQMGYTVRAIK